MINILIPLAGKSKVFEETYFPKPLFEINKRLMIEYPLKALNRIKGQKRFIFVIRDEDCVKFHLDKTLKLLTNGDTVVIRQKGDTKGSICSCLFAIDYIDNNDTLIISNGDQYLDVDYNRVLGEFKKQNAQGGVICFESVHPQWSYAKINEENTIVQTAEKNPISRNAIAGFYYFKKGADFVRAAKQSIIKDAHVNGIFYVAPVYNELVLEGLSLKVWHVDNDKYHSFFSLPKIKDFEKLNIKI